MFGIYVTLAVGLASMIAGLIINLTDEKMGRSLILYGVGIILCAMTFVLIDIANGLA